MFNQYLNVSSFFETPSLLVVVFTLLLALALSSAIALTYKFIFKKEHFQNRFMRAIIISSTVAAMVMMVVGDNLAVGVGVGVGVVVLGVASIFSFRILVLNTRNILFIVASISIGIVAGKYDYIIAISGTTLFCYMAFLLYYSPVESDQNK